MSEQEVSEHRKQLNGIKVRGKEPQKPIKNWNQCGLSGRVLDVIRKSGFDSPMPIQAQALPVIMSGRDCIGIAETGSGKTLAFVLPMLRHIKDQPPVQQVRMLQGFLVLCKGVHIFLLSCMSQAGTLAMRCSEHWFSCGQKRH